VIGILKEVLDFVSARARRARGAGELVSGLSGVQSEAVAHLAPGITAPMDRRYRLGQRRWLSARCPDQDSLCGVADARATTDSSL